jgi:hypothetical protein
VGLNWYPNTTYTATCTFRDAEGKVGKLQQRFTLQEATPPTAPAVTDVDAAVEAWGAALAQLSNANVYSISWTKRIVQSVLLPPEAIGGFDSIEDKAEIVLTDQEGNIQKVQVPAPSDSIFLGNDNETVQPTSTPVAAYNTLLTTPQVHGTAGVYWTTNLGNPLAAYIAGYRRRAKTRRKFRPGIASETGGD